MGRKGLVNKLSNLAYCSPVESKQEVEKKIEKKEKEKRTQDLTRKHDEFK